MVSTGEHARLAGLPSLFFSFADLDPPFAERCEPVRARVVVGVPQSRQRVPPDHEVAAEDLFFYFFIFLSFLPPFSSQEKKRAAKNVLQLTWQAWGLVASVVTAQSTGYHCWAQLKLLGGGVTAAAGAVSVWEKELVAATVEVVPRKGRGRRRRRSGVVCDDLFDVDGAASWRFRPVATANSGCPHLP